MTQEEKQQAIDMLTWAYIKQNTDLLKIESRLHEYYRVMLDEPQYHNAYEILGAIKFLRLLRTYEWDKETFRDVVYKYEGKWEQDQRDGVWRHIEGGLKHPGTTGQTYYRLSNFQVFVLASMFLLKVWINTEAEAGSRDLLPTEKIVET